MRRRTRESRSRCVRGRPQVFITTDSVAAYKEVRDRLEAFKAAGTSPPFSISTTDTVDILKDE